MKIRLFSKTGRTCLVAALPLCATIVSSPALAVDAVGGSASNINVVVPGAGWTILRSVNFSNPAQRYCTATGSADAVRPTLANGESVYYFTVSNTPNPIFDQGQERTLTFWNQAGIWDNRIKEITTTGGWMSPANADPGYFTVAANPFIFGSRTLYFLARKAAAATPNLTVIDASLTVTCTDNRLVPPLIIFDPVSTK